MGSGGYDQQTGDRRFGFGHRSRNRRQGVEPRFAQIVAQKIAAHAVGLRAWRVDAGILGCRLAWARITPQNERKGLQVSRKFMILM